MFTEFSVVMDYALEKGNFLEALELNVFSKKSGSSLQKTSNYLKTLYGFDPKDKSFSSLCLFWSQCNLFERRLITVLYALLRDDLLSQSVQVIQTTPLGSKLSIESIEDNIDSNHPNRYSPKTRKSLAQNLASSWKQAGFIEGKTKNIRVQPEISSTVATFAFFLAFLNGDRGEFILTNPVVKSLCLNEAALRDLAIEAAKQDLLQYQYGGNVTSFAFPQLLSKLQIQV